MEKQWHEARPQLTKKMLEENPYNPLEVMRYVKQIDEYHRNLTALTAKTMELVSFTNDLFDYEIAHCKVEFCKKRKKERTPLTLNINKTNIINKKRKRGARYYNLFKRLFFIDSYYFFIFITTRSHLSLIP